MYKFLFYIILIKFSIISISYSQCCSIGIPSAGTVNIGIVPVNSLRITSFYRYSYSNTYYEGSHQYRWEIQPIKSSLYHYVGATVGYGITEDFMFELEAGYFISKMQDRGIVKPEGFGLSNWVINAKYNVFNLIDEDLEMTVGLGPKLPFTGEPQFVNNVRLPDDIQPSTNAYGAVIQLFFKKGLSDEFNLFLIHRTEINTANNREFKYGNLYSTSLFVSKRFYDVISALIQIRGDIKDKDALHGSRLSNTGNFQILLSPQLNYSLDNWNVSLLFDYPVYKYYNEKQLANKFSFALNLSVLLDFTSRE